ncbi:YeiH family protein [Amycolatopsis sp. NBC_00355]|uniref:putative sulfate exporter family transporter n=1 Tax=Amycolatopsis sp. NBC_00355 TaxID=2975957 RepID=UPI002E25E02D
MSGVSAIIAGRGAIDADDEDSGYAIAAILALGAVALFTFPLIGHALNPTDTQFGLWAGLAVDNTAETTATGAAYSPHAQDVAVAVKSTRNALIGLVVLGYAAYWSTRGGKAVASGLKGRTVHPLTR